MAKGLPFDPIVIPEFRARDYAPVRVRQKRTYPRRDREMLSISNFLVERGMVDLLTPEQTQQLFKEIHWCAYQVHKLARRRYLNARAVRAALVQARQYISEIEAAEEELFIANRRLVVSCAKPFFWIGQVWFSDFLQEGSKALTHAARKYDFTRGTPFYAYAQMAVRNRLRNYFRDHVRAGSIGIRPTREMIAIKTLMDEWKTKHTSDPDLSVIARLTGLPIERVQKTMPFIRQWETLPVPPLSLDADVGENESSLYSFLIDPDLEEAVDAAQRSEVWSAIEKLSPRERYIMRLRFLEGHTLEETGDILKLTRARIKQIQDDALRKLRQILRRGIKNPRM